jgi:hypothetical protein
MKNLLLTSDYLSAMKREINKRLENHFLNFGYCLETTYLNDERGSFEFTVDNIPFKLYTPDMLGDEFYNLHLANTNETFIAECHNLTILFFEIEKYINTVKTITLDVHEDMDGEFYVCEDMGLTYYLTDLIVLKLDEINLKATVII